MFDGLDMHIYTLVATPFVAELLRLAPTDKLVGERGAMINAAFLIGWAFGGAFFGRIGDVLGRSKALCLTILTYAGFTGLSAISTEWWHLMGFRFLSALGIGGEWAVGASLLAETWPRQWRPWIAATLQSAVNVGVLVACAAGWILHSQPHRFIFLVGVLPAFIVLWIRRAVPEPQEWRAARKGTKKLPGIADLFRGQIAKRTWLILSICAISLTAHWTFMFWQQKYIRDLPEVVSQSASEKNKTAALALCLMMLGSIAGNYLAGALASRYGYRRVISVLCLVYASVLIATFARPLSLSAALIWFTGIGACQGLFGLFTMCLPPLFPTLLRTTGAGFCYNIGRVVAAGGTVFFSLFTTVGDVRPALLYAAFLFVPAAILAWWLPESSEDSTGQASFRDQAPVLEGNVTA
jgi:MFS family permease